MLCMFLPLLSGSEQSQNGTLHGMFPLQSGVTTKAEDGHYTKLFLARQSSAACQKEIPNRPFHRKYPLPRIEANVKTKCFSC